MRYLNRVPPSKAESAEDIPSKTPLFHPTHPTHPTRERKTMQHQIVMRVG